MKSAFKIFTILALVALLWGSGFAAGWRWRERTPVIAPITAEIELDARNRPSALKQFVALPDGQTLQHGKQFKWEWHDEPMGCIVLGLQIEREDYDAGNLTGIPRWSDPTPTLEPKKPIDSAVLTKYPDER